MKLFLYLSDFIVPLMIFGIICYGITMKIPVYDTFVKGAKDGFLTVIISSTHDSKDVLLVRSDRFTP